MLNRAALIVRPEKPYLAWAASLHDSGLIPTESDEKTVYLIPAFETEAEGQQVLKKIFPMVFESELNAWHTDEADWPKKRTLTLFRDWFKIEMHSMVTDLCAYPLEDDENYEDQ